MRWTRCLRLESLTNLREHHMARHRRAVKQRKAARDATILRSAAIPPGPWHVRITRVGPRALDDDNLASSAKHVRDGIADALEVDDGDAEACTWSYAQRRCGPADRARYAVEVEIAHRADGGGR